MNRNITVAAAVAAALTRAGMALAAGPSIGTINSTPTTNTINIMGSSAIKTALTNSILSNFCGGSGNATIVTSNGTNTNFLGIACTPVSGQATNGGNYNVWIRYEGGSVSGYLPIVNSAYPLLEIDGPSLSANPITVNGNSEANGTNDSFSVSAGGSLTRHTPDLGIGDVEAAALIVNNYPSDYSTTVFGPPNPNGLFALATKGIIDEVYALYVNENSPAFTETPLLLSQQMVESIMSHQVTNWSQVYDINNNPVATSLAITIVNREQGSGSRTATDILMVGDGCSSVADNQKLFNKGGETVPPGAVKYFSTGDVLKAANSIPGAITYATIDNTQQATAPSTTTNLWYVDINGVAPSNLAVAQGNYPFWVEANYFNNAASTGADSAAINNIITALQTEGTTAAIADVNAIPNVKSASTGLAINTPHYSVAGTQVTPTGGGTVPVYINPYTRQNVTCHAPQYVATQP